MNEIDLIKKIKKLKKLEPEEQTFAKLEERIFLSIQKENFISSNKSPRPWFIGPKFEPVALGLLALCLVLLFTFNIAIFESDLNFISAQTRIAFASNRYDKAQEALRLSEAQLDTLNKTGNQAQLAYLSNSTDQTNAFMKDLRLVGEPGKYSSAQCLTLYKEYGEYLENLNSTLQSQASNIKNLNDQTILQNLQSKAAQYKNEATTRVKLY